MAYDAEKQMLREFFLLYAPREKCFFCGDPIAITPTRTTFGHRRHTKIWELNFTVHHDDENRDNNTDINLKGSHSTCHRRYHKQLLQHGGGREEKSKVQKEGEVTRV